MQLFIAPTTDFSLQKAHFPFLGHVYTVMINSSTGVDGGSKIINCGLSTYPIFS